MQNKCFDRNKYNDKIATDMQQCVAELLELGRKNNISKLRLKDHKIEIPSATFNDENGNIGYEKIEEIEFRSDMITIFSKNFTAYLERTYGDYFDVGQSTPHIYAAVIDCIKDGLHAEELKGTSISTYQYHDGKIIPTLVNCITRNGMGITVNGIKSNKAKDILLRTFTAINSVGYTIPDKSIEINIYPALPDSKFTSMLDVPIALAILAQTGRISIGNPNDCIIGELKLNGSIRPSNDLQEIITFHTTCNTDNRLFVPDDGNIEQTDKLRCISTIKGAIRFLK